MTAALSVVITHYRTPDVLMRCLETVTAIDSPRLGEIVVADGEADEALGPRLAERFPDVRWLPVPTNVGFGALVNLGVANTTSPYVLVLNADVRVDAACLEALGAHLDTRPGCGLVAPMLRNDDGTLQDSTFRFHRPPTVLYRRTPLQRTRAGRVEQERFRDLARRDAAITADAPVDVDWVLGAAMAVRRTAIDEVGLMDAAYFLYFEDVDWCLRFWQRGWTVTYLPTARATHSHGRASARGGLLAPLVNPLTRRHMRSAVRFFTKHGPYPQRASVSEAAEPALAARS